MKTSMKLFGVAVASTAVAVLSTGCEAEVDYVVDADNTIRSSWTVSVDANDSETVESLKSMEESPDCSSETVGEKFALTCVNPVIDGIAEGAPRDAQSGFALLPRKDGSFVFKAWQKPDDVTIQENLETSDDAYRISGETTINVTMPSAITDVAVDGDVIDTTTDGNRTSVRFSNVDEFSMTVTSVPLSGGITEEVPGKVKKIKVKKGQPGDKRTVVAAKWKAPAAGDPDTYQVSFAKKAKGEWRTVKSFSTSDTAAKAKLKNKKRYRVSVWGVNSVGEGPVKSKKFRLR